MRMTTDGKNVSPEHSSDLDPRMMRAAFNPAWEQQKPREIVTEWDLMPQPSAPWQHRSRAAGVSSGVLYRGSGGTSTLAAAQRSFRHGRPDSAWTKPPLTVSSPWRIFASWLARASFSDRQCRCCGEPGLTQVFHINPGDDFLPYVVAGRYQEQVLRTRDGAVSFWTFQPLDAQLARTAAARLSASMRALTDFLVPRRKGATAVHVVEAPRTVC